jgi:hypothetical protein
VKEVTMDLLCELDEDELRDRGRMLSSTLIEYDTVEADKKEATKGFSEQLKGLRGTMRRLSVCIRTKTETRPVQCIVDFNSPVNGTKRITRIDTGEFVRDEPMSAQDCQNNLFEVPLEGPKSKPN